MNRVKLMRYNAGLKIAEVVAKTEVPERTLYRIEAGDRPSPKHAKALADFYEITVAELLGLTDERAAA